MMCRVRVRVTSFSVKSLDCRPQWLSHACNLLYYHSLQVLQTCSVFFPYDEIDSMSSHHKCVPSRTRRSAASQLWRASSGSWQRYRQNHDLLCIRFFTAVTRLSMSLNLAPHIVYRNSYSSNYTSPQHNSRDRACFPRISDTRDSFQ
jgi:hypothetical protein